MNYSRLNLADGQVLKAEHLRHIEEGIEATNYIGARNMLFNSDFSDVLNSKGDSSYSSLAGGDLPCIDKWLVYGAVVEVRKDEIYVYGSTDQAMGIYQNVPINSIDSSKTYTFAACKTDGEIVAVQINFSQGAVFSSGELYVYRDAGYYFTIGNGSWKWAALYEGAYTAETLPSYITKGRVTELANINGGAITMTRLWVNASPNSSYGANTEYLDMTNVDGVIVRHRNQTGGTYYKSSGYVPVGADGMLSYSAKSGGSSVRKFSVTSAGVTFEAPSSGVSGVSESTTVVPIEIYGIKGVLK